MKNKIISWIAAVVLASPATAAGIKILNSAAHYPEGPLWYQGKLYYVEYDRNTVTVWDGRKNAVFISDPGCGPSAVIVNSAGEFLTTCYDNASIGRAAPDGRLLPRYTQTEDGQKFIAPNDFAPDGHGGIYFSDSGHDGKLADGKVFYIDAAGKIKLVAENLASANGLAVSRDGAILYVIETENGRLLRFTIAAGPVLSNRQVFVDLNELTGHVTPVFPDGMKIDSKGQIYIGQNSRTSNAPLMGEIFVVDGHAKLLRTLKLPSMQVPNLTFSPDEKTVYVTAVDQIDKPPHLGKIYAIANR